MLVRSIKDCHSAFIETLTHVDYHYPVVKPAADFRDLMSKKTYTHLKEIKKILKENTNGCKLI